MFGGGGGGSGRGGGDSAEGNEPGTGDLPVINREF